MNPCSRGRSLRHSSHAPFRGVFLHHMPGQSDAGLRRGVMVCRTGNLARRTGFQGRFRAQAMAMASTAMPSYCATKSISAYIMMPDFGSLRSVTLTAASLELPFSASNVRLL